MSQLNSKVQVCLGAAKKYLRYDFNALAELQDLLHVPIMQILHEVQGGSSDAVLSRLGFKEVRALLFVGLKSAGSKLRLHEVGAKASPQDFGHYVEKIFEALSLALGATQEAEAQPDPTQAASQ